MDTGLRACQHRFKLGEGAVAEDPMSADSVIEYFDPFENVMPAFFAGPIALMMHVFRFQRMKEAFDDRIVTAIPASTHAGCQVVTDQCLAVPGGGV